MTKLIETAKKERYYNELDNELNDLRNKMASSKSADFINHKAEIIEILQEQIAFHYDLNEGQAEVSLKHDKAIMEARKILQDSLNYNKLLSSN